MNQVTDYKFIKLDELYSQPPEINRLVKNYIPSESIGMSFGVPGSEKPHIALSLAVSITNSIERFGQKTKEEIVLIPAGKGNNGSHLGWSPLFILNKYRKSLIVKSLGFILSIVFIVFFLFFYNNYRLLGAS